MRRKNVIIFYTDQQRADSLGCMGNALARTPHVDGLADRGTLYRRHYSANPVCMPSRACFLTGRYPQAHRLIDNGIFLPDTELTMPEAFRRAGYRTASFGKIHLQTTSPYPGDASMESWRRWRAGELDRWFGPYYGFEHVEMTVGHGEHYTGHYGRWRERQFPDLKMDAENALPGDTFPQFGSYKSAIPLEAHSSTWVANRAVDFLEHPGEQPFLLHVSFPDPHHPFTPPAPYCTMFDDVEFPAPHAMPGENDTKPQPWRRAMQANPFPTDGGARFFPDLAGKAHHQIVAHTYGMIALIDECVGRVLAALEQSGQAGRTVIVFTSDHGDFLGDHHLLYKGQLPCRSLLNTPLVIVDPDRPAGPCDAVCGNVDVMPTLLASCGLDVPECVQGDILPGPGARPGRDYAFAAGWSKSGRDYLHYTIYKDNWRISAFPNLGEGELYDLQADPWEHRNLFDDPSHRARRDALMAELLYAVGAAEPAKPPVLAPW